MLTDLQRRTAEAVVNVFETGKPAGRYDRVVVARNDAGHLTYGRSQTTLASGNLFLLIKRYCEAPAARFAGDLEPYLPRLAARDLSLDHDMPLRRTLKDAGADPVMRTVQDDFFEAVYWRPAEIQADRLGLREALSVNVVYDSTVHGSFARIRDRTTAAVGSPAEAGERAWVRSYIATRRAWLLGFDLAESLLPLTVYRMDELDGLAANGKWDLALPIRVRGLVIDENVLGAEAVPGSAVIVEERLLRLRSPMMQGEDVRQAQAALVAKGLLAGPPDGIFGPATAAAVEAFQAGAGLRPDGIVGPATRAALGL